MTYFVRDLGFPVHEQQCMQLAIINFESFKRQLYTHVYLCECEKGGGSGRVCFFDLKIFYTINHAMLTLTLQQYGITNLRVKWFILPCSKLQQSRCK